MKSFKYVLIMSIFGLFLGSLFVYASKDKKLETEMVSCTSPPIAGTSDVKPDKDNWLEQSVLWCKRVDYIIGLCKIDRIKFREGKTGKVFMTEIVLKSKVSCIENAISFFTLSYEKPRGLDMAFHIQLPADKHDLLGDGSGVVHFGSYSSFVVKSVEEKIAVLESLDIADRESGKGRRIYDYHCEDMFDMVREIQYNKQNAGGMYSAVLWRLSQELKNVLSRIWLNFQIKMYKDRKFDEMGDKERLDYMAQCSMLMAQRRLELFLLKEISEKICDGSISESLPLGKPSFDYNFIFRHVIDYARLLCQQGFAYKI